VICDVGDCRREQEKMSHVFIWNNALSRFEHGEKNLAQKATKQKEKDFEKVPCGKFKMENEIYFYIS
jgi:hypothetical protein